MLLSIMEMQDVVDDNDNVIQTLPRDEIWGKGLQSHTRVVNVFIIDENDNFLVPIRSSKKKNWPLCYDFACGENLFAGETYEQALTRGMKEELNISQFKSQLVTKLSPSDGEVCFMSVYKVFINSADFSPNINPDEVDHLEWMGYSDLLTLVKSNPEKFKNGYPELFSRLFVE